MLFQAWQWQLGVVSVLFLGMQAIDALNRIPVFSAFLPITTRFMKMFCKIAFYILLIVFLFSFVFYLTLNTNPAFSYPPQALVKTIMWLLGDLSYDITFVSDNLRYPWLANIIFLVFVTSVAAFIANLFVSNPLQFIVEYTKMAEWNKYRLCVNMFLDFDIFYPKIRKSFIVSHYKYKKDTSDPTDRVRLAFQLLKQEKTASDEKTDMEKRLTRLEDLLQLQNDLILQLSKDKEN